MSVPLDTNAAQAAHYASVDLTFEEVYCSVTNSTDSSTTFQILQNVSGYAKRGHLMAIMGPSGAGKSTLLDILAGRLVASSTMKVKGGVRVNGAPIDHDRFQRAACYVMQEDHLPHCETVRECLQFNADTRLPTSLSKAKKVERVNTILDDLGLVDCADTLVGSEAAGIKGISGGQKRRLSVGLELITQPSCIFLDEPTSGLDSDIAVTIMQTLKQLAARGCTILLTIHQPNSDITELFDDFMLLARGRVVYAGPWLGATNFFSRHGWPCPTYKNPTDYFLKLVANDADAANTLADQNQLHWQTTKRVAGEPEEDHAAADLATTLPRASDAAREATTVPWYWQTYYLVRRNMRAWKRHPMMLAGEGGQYLFLSLFVGGMYFDVTNSAVDGEFSRAAATFFVLVTIAFTPPFTAVTLWAGERGLVRREEMQGTYSLSAFYAAKTLTLVPMEILFSLMVSAIVYFMIGFQRDAGKFFVFSLAVALCLLVSEAVGTLFALVTKTAELAIILASLVFIVILSFTGFLTASVPVYYGWIQDISFLRYANSALFINEMTGLELTREDGTIVRGEDLLPGNPMNNGLSVGQNIAVLAGMLVGLRILALFGLYLAKRQHWL